MKMHQSPSYAVFWHKAVLLCLPLYCYAATNTDTDTDTFAMSEDFRAGFNCSGYFGENHTATSEGIRDVVTEYDPVCKALNDERTFPERYYATVSGCIIASTSAVVSTICSILLITIIRRSSIGLSTVSHRLVFAMSIADILGSVAMGTTTLPMPKNLVYEFESMSIGNEFTCNVQGLLVTFGIFSAFLLNAFLAIYYMLTITYKISDATIQKVVEPIFYTLCILLTFPTAVLFWLNRWYNPSPFEPWCIPISYPWYCKPEDEDAAECSIRGIPSAYQITSRMFLKRYYLLLGLLGYLIIIYCMASIIRTAYRTEKNIKLLIRSYNARGIAEITEEDIEFARSKWRYHSHTKMMVMQAVAYTLAAFVANAASLVHLSDIRMAGEEPNLELSTAMMICQIVYAVVRPSQGLLNFIVFLGQKAYDRRRINTTLTWKQAMRTVLFDREDPHYVMSDLNMLHQDDHRRQQMRQIQEEEDKREDDFEEHENDYDNFNVVDVDADADALANMKPAGPDARELSAGTIRNRSGNLPPIWQAGFNSSRSRTTNEFDDPHESKDVSYDPSSRNPDSLSMFESYDNDSGLSTADIK